MRRSVGTREWLLSTALWVIVGDWWAGLSLELEHQLLEVWLKTASAGELKECLYVVIGGRAKKGDVPVKGLFEVECEC